MWWNGHAWGPMYGWWIMPIIAIVFMVIVLFIVSRFFGGIGGFCGRKPMDNDESIKELKKEIQELKNEIRELKNISKKAGD